MSSYDGGGFVEWVEDSFFLDAIAPSGLAQIKTILEPYRETIEHGIEDYDAEERSWRDHRNMLWRYVDRNVRDQIRSLLITHGA